MAFKKYLIPALILIQIILFGSIANAADPPQRPDNFEAELPVYVSSASENRVNLSWSASTGADFYILEIASDINWAGQTITETKHIASLSYTDIRQNTYSSPTTGTVFRYKLYAATYLRDGNNEVTDEFISSTNYASISVLTDPAASSTALSTSEIKLTWDDIKCSGNSIDYEIVKFKKGVNVGQEQIRANEIGQSAVRLNGKLVYTITGLDKSTEYSFQLYPSVSEANVIYNSYITINGATHISALIQRYNESIIKLMWDEYQGSVSATDLYYRVIQITEVNGQKSYQTIATPDVPYYFAQIQSGEDRSYLIEVRNKEDDTKVAESSELSLMDMVVPAVPIVSDLEITPSDTGLAVQWDTHKTITNERDSQVKYDFWILSDPTTVDDVRPFYSTSNSGIIDRRTGKDLQIVDSSNNTNFSLETVSGEQKYRFNVTGLIPNTIYYIAVVAKKTYIMQDPDNQEVIISVSNNSEPVVATTRTTSGNLEQPISLVKPIGLSVRTDSSGNGMVTKNSISIKWPMGETVSGTFTPFYESDVYFRIGYEEYTEDFDKAKTNDLSNINYNIHTTNVAITTGTEESYATITGLENNTAYVFWLKAYRNVQGATVVTKVSEASDPIIVVTLPDYTVPNTKPPVPVISVIDNTYQDKITVQFNSIANIAYTISWAKEDSIAKSVGTKEYTPTSTLSPDSVVISDLDPETLYYFWIKATNSGLSSEWSDSVTGETIPIPPPDVPEGFGVKKILQSNQLVPDIGEHYVTLQWDNADGVIYILEVSKKEDFSSKESITLENVAEYKLQKFETKELASNTRYWIRLYAKDSSTEKISEYSPYLTVKTKTNYDEYNSSQESDTPLSGKIAVETINGTTGIWSVDLSGAKGDRLIEKLRNQDTMDYRLDLSQTSVSGINKREINISYKVADSLSNSSQNIIIKTNKAEFIFYPESLKLNDIEELRQNPSDEVTLKITLQSLAPSDGSSQYKYLSEISKINVLAVGKSEKTVDSLNKPIKIILNYTDDKIKGSISGYGMGLTSTSWEKIEGTSKTINAKAYYELFNDKTGKYCVKKQLLSTEPGMYANKEEILELVDANIIKDVNSSNLRPLSLVTLGSAVKYLLDSSGTEYDSDYMDIAQKAGILSALSNTDSTRNIKREEAISMVMRLCEIRKGEELAEIAIPGNYLDRGSISYPYNFYIANAIKMKILVPQDGYISSKKYVTTGEMLLYIKRLLDIIG